MGERIPQCSSSDVIRVFERLGFVVRRKTGSHVILRHPSTKRMVVVPSHSGDLKRGLLFTLLKQAGIDRDLFAGLL
jgi:predicted RNA binding protein YcfA (HicA-like mRNA interferase family)